MFTKQDAEKILAENNQQLILKDFDSLSASKKVEFLKQIENINWSDIKMISQNTSAVRGKFSVPPTESSYNSTCLCKRKVDWKIILRCKSCCILDDLFLKKCYTIIVLYF